MSNYKKAVAALTAIISMVSLGAGTILASAADLDAINEKFSTIRQQKKIR